jgi:hypothetical protein
VDHQTPPIGRGRRLAAASYRRGPFRFLACGLVVAVLLGIGAATPAPAQTRLTSTADRADPQPPRPPNGPWGRSRLVDPAAGWLNQVSCPTAGFCVAIDSYGSVVTDDGGQWSDPVRVVPPGHTSLSCISDTFCMAVGAKGQASLFDGAGWQQADRAPGAAFRLVSCVSSQFCMVAGPHGARTFDGRSWSRPKVVDADGELDALSCASPTLCVAGDNGGRVLAFDGTRWSLVERLGDASIRAVSCPSVRFCMVMDAAGRIVTFDGTTWKKGPTPPGLYAGLTCLSSSFCVMVGGFDATFYNGKKWSASQQVVNAESIFAVSCGSVTDCVALSDFDAATYDGSGWSIQRADRGQAAELSVSCPTSAFCAASDYYGNAFTYADGVWSSPAVVDPGGYWLDALSCTSASFCAAGDEDGNLLTFDGTAWTTPIHSDLEFVNGLSCATATFCMAVGDGTVSTYDGAGWSPAEPVDPGYFFTGVSCPSRTFCLAIDEGQNVTRALTWDGASWSAPKQIADGQIEAFSVQCPTTEFCMVATSYGGYATYDKGVWSGFDTFPGYLFTRSMSCTSPSFCVAVGDANRSLWNGTSWSFPERIDMAKPPHGGSAQDVGLTGVSCAATTFCAAFDARGRVLMTDHP